MAKQHAILAPSAAHRWLTCAPSARFEEQIADEETSFALEGTLAHDLAALILAVRTGQPVKNYNAQVSAMEKRVAAFYKAQGEPNAFQDMYDHAEDYAAFVRQFVPMTGKYLIRIEHGLDMSAWANLCFGTMDAGVYTPKVLYVNDLKYGKGVRVAATGNKQMMLYALGALVDAEAQGFTNFETVVMSIFQPRAGGASSWEIDTNDLLDWADDNVTPMARLAIAGQGDFVAGSHCRFCKARTSCKAYYDKFSDIMDLKDKRMMTSKDVAAVLKYGGLVAAWVKKVEDEARTRMAVRGEHIPGFKVVAGQSRRAFKNEDDVVDAMLGEGFDTEDIFKTTIRGITELEGLLGKKKFGNLFKNNIVEKECSPIIVDENDDRPAIGASGHSDYDDDLL